MIKRMFAKKIITPMMIVAMSAMVLVGCSSEPETEVGGATTENEAVKVQLLVTGSLGDKAFNDSANAGMKSIQEQFGDKVEIEVVEMGNDKTKFEPSLIDAAESDADLIITGLWDMKEHLENTAQLYPEKKFVIYDTDVAYDEYDLSNVYSMTYKQNESGFLAGALAASVTSSDMELANEEKTIGFVGALDTSAVINDFLVGYIEGAKFVDPEINVEVSYVGGFTDTAKAKEVTLAQYSNGVDVVFTAAGPASAGSIEAAKDSKKYVIGVDSDQALAYEGKEEQQYIISSALKNVNVSLENTFDAYMNNTLEFNSHDELSIADGAISLAKNDIYTSTVSEEIQTKVDEVTETLKNGGVAVSSAIGMEADALKTLIDSVKK